MNKTRILCFGDSLTHGFDPDSFSRFPESSRWPMILQEILGDGYRIVEEGQGGRTIASDDPAEGEKNGSLYIVPCLESHAPLDLVIVMLGTNDCKKKFGLSSADVAGEMELFLQKVLSCNHFRYQDHFKILLISPPLISDDLNNSFLEEVFDCEYAKKVSAGLAEKYRALSERLGIHFMNAADYVKTSRADGVHLDAAGQRKLAEAVAAYIRGAEHMFA